MAERSSAVTRDRAYIEREYGTEKWPRIEAIAEEVIAGEGTSASLARVVSLVRLREIREAGDLADQRIVLGGEQVEIPRIAGYGACQLLTAELVRSLSRAETDLIIELGSGWGRNLFNAWLHGAPAEAQYAAAEPTEAGRRAAVAIAAVEPRLRLSALEFDYTQPDLSSLTGHRHAVVLTSHSIEQVPELPARLFDEIRSLADSVSVAHLEPVSWQLGRPGVFTSADYAEHHDYNRNLVAALREQEDAGLLELGRISADVAGTNPDNPGTLICWSAGSPSS